MKKVIYQSTREACEAMLTLEQPKNIQFIEDVAHCLVSCFNRGNKLLIAGNGGSLCDAMHFAEELTGQFRKKRPGLPAISLSDPGHLTCTANDMGLKKSLHVG